MHVITSDPINEYTEAYSDPEPALLRELNLETQKLPGARMLSGHMQGRFLAMMSRILKPRNILEIGTYTGYSAICLSEGLAKGGTLSTIDNDASLQNIRDKYWQKAGLADTIRQYIGDAAQVLDGFDASAVDLVFVDADKRNYGLYFDMLIDKLQSGACILADNTLFHAEVVLPETQRSSPARHIHIFNEKIAEDSRVEQILLPLRDGITLMRKI